MTFNKEKTIAFRETFIISLTGTNRSDQHQVYRVMLKIKMSHVF